MTNSDSTVVSSGPSLESRLGHLGRALRSRRGLIVLAAAALALGVGFNWSWLVAAGIAPLLLSALPCAVMCALGICMTQMAGRSSRSASAALPSDPAAPSASLPTTGTSCCSPQPGGDRASADAPTR
ncbi:hypothetical protein [Hyphomicrobium sp.]|uniref:hypothetical protein n=1 Tax=Hyphomicrobium sp. TaxID=82 RepID=UPI000FA3260A|nr:hypothetical protein [Hyphomicrobium sp.]RUO99837.1 MAG: hypothetical protein EKK30_05125 [Hyphomicrobium sp.]